MLVTNLLVRGSFPYTTLPIPIVSPFFHVLANRTVEGGRLHDALSRFIPLAFLGLSDERRREVHHMFLRDEIQVILDPLLFSLHIYVCLYILIGMLTQVDAYGVYVSNVVY